MIRQKIKNLKSKTWYKSNKQNLSNKPETTPLDSIPLGTKGKTLIHTLSLYQENIQFRHCTRILAIDKSNKIENYGRHNLAQY